MIYSIERRKYKNVVVEDENIIYHKQR